MLISFYALLKAALPAFIFFLSSLKLRHMGKNQYKCVFGSLFHPERIKFCLKHSRQILKLH